MHELTEVIHNHYPPYCRESCDVPSYVGGWAEHVAAAVQAELVRASTVTTEAELNALPEFTVIGAPVRDDDGTIAARVPFLKSPEGTWYSGSEEVTDEELSQLFNEGNPIVLFRPEVTP